MGSGFIAQWLLTAGASIVLKQSRYWPSANP